MANYEQSVDYESLRNIEVPRKSDSQLKYGSSRGRSAYFIVGLVVSLVVLLAVCTHTYTDASSQLQTALNTVYGTKKFYSSSNSMSVIASNVYGTSQANMFTYPFLQGSLLVEPYKSTSFAVQDAVADATYEWTITSASSPTNAAADLYESSSSVSADSVGETIDSGSVSADSSSSASFETTLTSVGWYTLTVTETLSGSDSASRTFSQPIAVKYVRRELQDLTVDDRNTFLDAFHTLWEVNTLDGQAKYGDRYKSLHYLASVHNDAGANSVCDEFHGGAGI
jgi:hypothetical protein